MKRILNFILVQIILISVVSCGGGKKERKDDISEKINTSYLQGEWNIISVNGMALDIKTERPFLGFNIKDSQLYGWTGCNRIMGMLVTSETDPYMISFQSVGTTRMACQIFDIENQITLGLNTVASFEVTKCDKKDHRCASLLNKDNVVIFTLEERPEIDNSEQIEEEQGTP